MILEEMKIKKERLVKNQKLLSESFTQNFQANISQQKHIARPLLGHRQQLLLNL